MVRRGPEGLVVALLLCILNMMPLRVAMHTPWRAWGAGRGGRGVETLGMRQLQCLTCSLRGGGEAADEEPAIEMDSAYWHDIGPRMLTSIKDMMRATEKLLDHSAASLRALHNGEPCCVPRFHKPPCLVRANAHHALTRA